MARLTLNSDLDPDHNYYNTFINYIAIHMYDIVSQASKIFPMSHVVFIPLQSYFSKRWHMFYDFSMIWLPSSWPDYVTWLGYVTCVTFPLCFPPSWVTFFIQFICSLKFVSYLSYVLSYALPQGSHVWCVFFVCITCLTAKYFWWKFMNHQNSINNFIQI